MGEKQNGDVQKSLDNIASAIKDLAQPDQIEEVHKTLRDFAYQQSSKFSEIARKLIIGILGSAWAASLKDGNFSEFNSMLMFALIVSCIYLFVDAIHYFSDAVRYKKICNKIGSTQRLDGVNEMQNCTAESSNCFFIAKFILLIFVTVCFIVGFIIRYM